MPAPTLRRTAAAALVCATVLGTAACAGHRPSCNLITCTSSDTTGQSTSDTSSAPGAPSTRTVTVLAEPYPQPYAQSVGTAPSDGYTRQTGPRGIAVDVPAGWHDQAAAASYRQLGTGDPGTDGAMLRFGGYQPTAAALYDEISAGARGNPRIRDGYQQWHLAPASLRGHDAVDWEFTFVRGGVRRHVHGVYWREDGSEFLVYLSGPDADWDALRPVFDRVSGSVGIG